MWWRQSYKNKKNDIFTDWKYSEDFKNIEAVVKSKINFDVPIFPLKFSKVFDAIFEKEKSIKQIADDDALSKYTYRDVIKQFDEIYFFIENNYAK